MNFLVREARSVTVPGVSSNDSGAHFNVGAELSFPLTHSIASPNFKLYLNGKYNPESHLPSLCKTTNMYTGSLVGLTGDSFLMDTTELATQVPYLDVISITVCFVP